MYQICHVQQSTLASILVLEIYKAKKQLLILKIKVSGKQSLHFYQKKKPWLPVAILFLIDLMAITVGMEKCPYPIFNQFL
jgi:hypothetical protein